MYRNFFRIEAGKEELELTEFPLEVLLKESLMMFKKKAVKHDIEITTTGLRLTLNKKFLEMHDGRVWAESEHSKGSRFIFTLP